jgi:hypothetical protein
VIAVNPLAAFYDIHESKGKVSLKKKNLLFVSDTTRDFYSNIIILVIKRESCVVNARLIKTVALMILIFPE